MPKASLFLLLGFLFLVAGPARAVDLDRLPVLSAVPTDSVTLPSDGIRGLAFHGGRLWLLCSGHLGLSAPDTAFTASVVQYNLSTGALDTLVTESDAFESGLTHDGQFLWSAGSLIGGRTGLYQIDPALREVVLSLPIPGYHPAGLAFDGSYVWQTDSDSRKLYRLEIEEGKVSRKVPTPGFYPTGLAFDGFHFWCADAATGRLYRLRGTNGRVNGVVDAEAYLRPGEFVSLAWDGRALWAVGADDRYAVRLELIR